MTKKDKVKWVKGCFILHQEKTVEKTCSIKLLKEEKQSRKSLLFLLPHKHQIARSRANQIVFCVTPKESPTNKEAKMSKIVLGQVKDHPKACKTISQKLVAKGSKNKWAGDSACWLHMRHQEGEIDTWGKWRQMRLAELIASQLSFQRKILIFLGLQLKQRSGNKGSTTPTSHKWFNSIYDHLPEWNETTRMWIKYPGWSSCWLLHLSCCNCK